MTAGTKKLARQEHFVPRVYLESFCDSDGRIYVYEKGREARPSIPENECRERDFYEFEINGRHSRNSLENWLGRIETDAGVVLPLIIADAPLTVQQRITWAFFVGSLFARSRKVRSQMSNRIVGEFFRSAASPTFIQERQYRLLQDGVFRSAEDLKAETDGFQKFLLDNPGFYHSSGVVRKTRLLADVLLKKQWGMVDAPAEAFFITSDCPVVTVERVGDQWHLGGGFGKANVAVCLPLSPRRLFVAATPPLGWRGVADISGVQADNSGVVRFGERNAFAHVNSPLISNLVDVEINASVFGESAFLPGAT